MKNRLKVLRAERDWTGGIGSGIGRIAADN